MKKRGALIDKKGFSLAFAIYMVILISVVIIVLNSLLGQILIFVRNKEASYQAYEDANFGIYRGKWLLDGAVYKGWTVTGLPGGTHNGTLLEEDVTITITCNNEANHDYDITSSVTGRSITARYLAGSIVSWD